MNHSDNRLLIRSTVIGLLTVAIAASGISQVCAQSGEDIAKGLIRALIDSTLDKQRRRQIGQDPFLPAAPRAGLTNPQRQQLRTVSATYAQEAAALSARLHADARRDFHLRPLLASVFSFEATAAAVRRQTSSAQNHAALMDSYRQLNASWLTLSHQLREQRGVSPQTVAVLDRIGQLDAQYCSVLGIHQQFDLRELSRTVGRLAAEIQHLSGSLRYDVPSSATRARIIRRLQQLSRRVDQFAIRILDNRRTNGIVAEYQQLYDSWNRLAVDLDRYDNHAVTRNVQAVALVHQRIHELLRLERVIDKRFVLHVIRDMDAAMIQLFQEITLADLMSLAHSDDVPPAADTAYGTLQHLADVVQRDESRQEIGDAWAYVNEAWELLDYYLLPVGNIHVRQHLEEVSGSLTALKQTIGVVVAWDRREMVQCASSLESLAQGIHQSVQSWHQTAGIRDPRRSREAQELTRHCHTLGQLILERRGMDKIREECDYVVQSWQNLRPYLRECQTAESESLQQLAGGFTPELVRIRMALPE